MKKIIAILISLTLCWTMVGCGASVPNTQSQANTSYYNPNSVAQGQYPVQQATYNDVDGEYTLMLLNTPSGTAPVFRTKDLQMARLTEADLEQGKKTYLEVKGNQGIMYLTEDFKIEYVHNLTETKTNPQTGQPETVIVRQQSSFWTPFAGAVAGQLVGQAIGSMLFTPQYYIPPVYQPGGVLTGYGGYGRTYTQAVDHYQTRYQTPPPAVKNQATLRTSRNLKSPSPSTSTKTSSKTQATGKGYGSSNLGTSKTPSRTPVRRSSGSFGSSRRLTAGRRR